MIYRCTLIGLFLTSVLAINAQTPTDPPVVALAGHVKSIQLETAKLDGQIEGARVLKEITKYDEMRNIISDVSYSSNGSPRLTTPHKYSYDDKGRIIETDTLDGQGNITDKAVPVFDPSGVKTLVQHYERYGSPTEHDILSYDKAGNLIKIERVFPMAPLSRGRRLAMTRKII